MTAKMMETHEEIEALIPAYAIGAAEPEEARRVEHHVAQCPSCRSLLAQYRQLATDMLYAIPLVEPPDHLKDAVMRSIARETPPEASPRPAGRARFLFPRLVRVAAAVAIVLLFLSNAFLVYRTNHLEEQARAQATALAVLAEAPAITLKGDAPAPDAHGVVYMRPEANVALLHVYNLPPVPEGKAYQVWLIYDGQRDSGGLFRVNEEGEAVLLIRAPRPLSEYQAIGVTVEPATGSPGPTGPRVIGGAF